MRKYLQIMLCVMAACLMQSLAALRAQAGTIYDSPYVTFSSTGEAWTTNASDRQCEHYPSGTMAYTGIETRQLNAQTGEHIYRYSRKGIIPIAYWKCVHSNGQCIHDSYTQESTWYGVKVSRNSCGREHYSGWLPYCADCGEPLTYILFYMSDKAAASIASLNTSVHNHYYYLCPYCNNLEQGRTYDEHICKAVSYNQYKVEYDANAGSGRYGGYMLPSYHMYNDAGQYEGSAVTPITHLTKNSFTRVGMEFAGWNTKPDGTGTFYEDGAKIRNLTDKDWQEEPEGTVKLYAQWKPSRSSLLLDPNGGSYEGRREPTVITQDYLTVYVPSRDKITAPDGYTVTFDTCGGEAVRAITGTCHFVEWQQEEPFEGGFLGEQYIFSGSNGHKDKLTALYEADAILLPMPSREGSSFGGWYYDAAYNDPAGGENDAFIPKEDVTLYAQWVDLRLYAADNYAVNAGKGAVDLNWTQADGQDKVYQLYQSMDGVKWRKISEASDQGEENEVDALFAYTGSVKSYVVPQTGFYVLTAGGAAGGDYSQTVNGRRVNYIGGAGGRVSAKVWLSKGEILTYTIGGSNGYSGGGQGSVYGNGGGSTVVNSNRKGTLLIAGGGGGAGGSGNGGAGGSAASLRSDKAAAGASGQAGGGGGLVGGNAGTYVVHRHSAQEYPTGCYRTTNTNYEACSAPTVVMSTGRAVNVYSVSAPEYTTWSSKNGESISGKGWKQTAHTSSDQAELGLTVSNIAVNGNKQVTLWFLFDAEEMRNTDIFRVHETYAQLTDQSGRVLWSGTQGNIAGYLSPELGYWNGATVTAKYNRHHFPACYEVKVTVDIPAGSTTLKFVANMGHTGAWMNIFVKSIYLSGGVNKSLVCGYTDGQVISSKPAYGGSNYVNKQYAYTYTDEAGKQKGDGFFQIQGEAVGYLEELQLVGVSATDRAAPDAIRTEDVSKTAVGAGQVEIAWRRPDDKGTEYLHRAQSYRAGDEQLLCTSNITSNTLVSGIKGYYYVLDGEPETPVTASPPVSNAGFLSEERVRVTLGVAEQYLHVAAVDVAGNVGATVHVEVGTLEQNKVDWPIVTKQMSAEPADNVYADESAGGYYVKSDGRTPFTLHFLASMNGVATQEYQLNYSVFETEWKGESAKNILFTPSEVPGEKGIVREASDITFTSSGRSPLARYSYTRTERTNWGRDLFTVQQFLLEPVYSGEKIFVFPRGGADRQNRQIYSDITDDKTHGICLIGDGEAPVIRGAELLENLADRLPGEGTIEVKLSAQDALSGLREFYVEVENTDNACRERYSAGEDGVVVLKLQSDIALYEGDFTIRLYAADHVGNETVREYKTSNFGLEVEISRMLEPHTPVFVRGESGILTITTYGYADRVEVEFPAEFGAGTSDIDKSYLYDDGHYLHEERLQFMIPLEMPVQDVYHITVKAYKGDRVLEERPVLGLIGGETSILDELRTRLR